MEKYYQFDTIITLYNEKATKARIITVFNRLLNELKSDDSLLIYYAGHGHYDQMSATGFWIPVNAGLDDSMFSDTLFGHKKGAFTGANEERKGLIESAENGTLFLDEISDLPMPSQVNRQSTAAFTG